MKTHVFTTFDKKTYHITQAEHQRLTTVGAGDYFATSQGALIKGSSINAIMPLKDYYEQNPKERPENKDYLELPPSQNIPLDKQAEQNEYRYRGLLSGYALRYETHPTKNLKAELESRKKRYYQLFRKEFIFEQQDKLRARKALAQTS